MFLSPPQSAASSVARCMAALQALLRESAFNQRSLNQRMREATVTQIYPGMRQRPSGLHPILLLTVYAEH